MTAQDGARVEAVLRREGRSLLQYVNEASPWSKAGASEGPAKLRQVGDEQRDASTALARLMGRRRYTVGHLGPFPMSFTTINFTSLDYLLPRLAADQKRTLTALEHDRAAVADPEVQAELDRYLAMKRRHIQMIEALAPAAAGK